MAPRPLQDLDDLVERTQSQLLDPAERDRALAALERGTNDTLGKIRTYRNDTRLQMKGGEAPVRK